LYGLRSGSWVWYLLWKGDIGSVSLDIRIPPSESRIALLTNSQNIDNNPNNDQTFYVEDDAHLYGVARKTVQYRIWTNSDWTHLVLTGGQWFSNVQWRVLQGANAPGLTISATTTALRIHKQGYDTTPVEVLFTATLNGLVYGEAVIYESRKGSLGQTRIQVYGVPGPTGKRTEIAREINNRSGTATNPYPFTVWAREHAEWEDIVGAFFYPWYGNAYDNPPWSHWNEGGYSPPCSWASHFLPDILPGYYPPSELYSSNSFETFRWQTQLMAQAGIELGIVSWWGMENGPNADYGYSDRVFRRIINDWMNRPGMPPIKWTVYLEAIPGFVRRSDLIYQSIRYIVTNYGNSPHFVRLYGAPLLFVYAISDNEVNEFAMALQQLWQEGIIVYLNGHPPDYTSSEALRAFQAWHYYEPAHRETHAVIPGAAQSRSVSPGFWKYNETPRLQRDAGGYQTAIQRWADISSRHSHTTDPYVQFLLIETWNEYNEGTQIEPAHAVSSGPGCYTDLGSYGRLYVDITNQTVRQFKMGEQEGDVNGDGCVNDSDLLTVLFVFGSADPVADLNRDGVVDDADLLLVLFHFGSEC